MLTGLILASVFGALALPDIARLTDALGLTDDDSDGNGSSETSHDHGASEGDMLSEDPGPADRAGGETVDVPETEAPLTDGPPLDSEPADADLEILGVDVVPGVMEFEDFDPEAQEVALHVPEYTTGYLTHSADPDADPPLPARLTFEVPDGAVEVRFNGMDEVPVDAISLSAAGADAVGIEQVLLNDDPGLQPDDPEAIAVAGTLPGDPALPTQPNVSGEADDSSDDEPEASDAPQEPVAPSAPMAPDDGDSLAVAGELADEDALNTAILPVTDTSLGAQPHRIEAFDPEEDVLEIEADPDDDVALMPTEDGLETEVRINDILVAVVAIPQMSEGAIRLVPPS